MRAVHVRRPPWSVLRGYSAWVAASEPHDAPSRRVYAIRTQQHDFGFHSRHGGHPRVNVSGSSLKERGQGCGDRPESCVELIVTPESPQGIPPKPKLWAGPLPTAATHCPPPLGVMAHTWHVGTWAHPGSWHMGARDRTVRNKRKVKRKGSTDRRPLRNIEADCLNLLMKKCYQNEWILYPRSGKIASGRPAWPRVRQTSGCAHENVHFCQVRDV